MRRGNTKEAEAVAKQWILDEFNGDMGNLVSLYNKEKAAHREFMFAKNYLNDASIDEMDRVLCAVFDMPMEKAESYTIDETINKFHSYMQRVTEKMVSQYEKENAPKKTLSDVKKSVAEQKNSVEHTETNTKHNGR